MTKIKTPPSCPPTYLEGVGGDPGEGGEEVGVVGGGEGGGEGGGGGGGVGAVGGGGRVCHYGNPPLSLSPIANHTVPLVPVY